MATKNQHLQKVDANESFADRLDVTDPCSAGWAITALFYAAVHQVEAYFASVSQRYVTHKSRNSAIQRDIRIREIYDDYRELSDMSREARYDCSILTPGNVKWAKDRLKDVKDSIRPFL